MEPIGDRLRQARIKAGFTTATEAARAFGWRPPTYMGHENGDRQPSREAALRYSKAFRVSVEWLLTGRGEGASSKSGLLEAEVYSVPVLGDVQAGAWLEVDEMAQDEAEMFTTARDPRFPGAQHVAYRVRGDSYDRVIKDGGIVVCVPWDETGFFDPVAGMTVVAEQSMDGAYFQRTLKKVEGRPGNFRLVPQSTNPRHQPIVPDENGDVKVIALVVQFVSPASW